MFGFIFLKKCSLSSGISSHNLVAEIYSIFANTVTGISASVVLYSPVDDFGAPGLGQLKEVVNWINKEISTGGKVLVHCFAGIGRTGTVLIACLLNRGVEMSLAIEKVLSLGSAPQSDEQMAVLNNYCEDCLNFRRMNKTVKGQ